MKTSFAQKSLAVLVLAALALQPAAACSVCYGEPDAPMTRGLTWAILALGTVVVTVLSGVVVFFVHLGRRSAGGSAGAPADTAVNQPD